MDRFKKYFNFITKRIVPRPPVVTSEQNRKNDNMRKAIQVLNKSLDTKTYFGGVPTAKIGNKSVNGAVFSMNMNNKSRKVLKIVKSPLGAAEYAFQKNTGNAGISPKVYKLKTNVKLDPASSKKFFKNEGINRINAFLMNNLKRKDSDRVLSLNQVSRTATPEQKKAIFEQLKRKIYKLQKLGIEHGDLHFGNVYVVFHDNKTFELIIIDFGRARKIGPYTRSVVKGLHGIRYGKNVSKEWNWYEPLYKRTRNETPVILDVDKLKYAAKVLEKR